MKIVFVLALALFASESRAAEAFYDMVKKNFDTAKEVLAYSELPTLSGDDNQLKCAYAYKSNPTKALEKLKALGRHEVSTDPTDPLRPPTVYGFVTGPLFHNQLGTLYADIILTTRTVAEANNTVLHTANRSTWSNFSYSNVTHLTDATLAADLWVRKHAKGFYLFRTLLSVTGQESWQDSNNQWHNTTTTKGDEVYGYCWKP